jgi:intracellular septation protein
MKPQPETNMPVKVAKSTPDADRVWAKLAIELGPLLVFFGTNAVAGIYAGTAAFMAATLLSLAVAWLRYHKVPVMPLVSGVIVLVFGGLTLYLRDETFIKLKPTIVYSMFAVILAYGLVTGKPLLQALLESAYPGLSAKGWRLLTINWTGFFVVMAVLNEVVRHLVDWDQWLTFKTWAVIPMTLVFAMLNIPMLLKHGLQLEKPADAPIPPEG